MYIGSKLVGVGYSVPDKVLTNFELENMVDTNDNWIKTRTGISERRITDHNMATSDLATKCALKAIETAGITPDEIELIIVATTSPDHFFPSTACIVQDNIKAVNAAAFDIAAACSGFIYSLAVADSFIKSGQYSCILTIGADTLTKFLNWEDRNTCVLFGDGAGAVIVKKTQNDNEGILSCELGVEGWGRNSLMIPGGGSRYPSTGNNGNGKCCYIEMNGKEVFKFAVNIIEQSIRSSLKKVKIKPGEVDWYILHQANSRIIESSAKRLDVPLEKFIINIHKYGNTSAASIPIALSEACSNNDIKFGDLVVFCGFGAGFTFGTIVVRWSELIKDKCAV